MTQYTLENISYVMCPIHSHEDRSLFYFVSSYLCKMLINLTIIVGCDGVFKDLKT
jgi:hypothetical protein